jgi:diamine N-acetyltransferase
MLKGRNIVLRPLQNTDLDFLFEIENNIKNWQFGSEKKKYNKQELLDYITNTKTDISLAKQYRFVIDLNSTPIGFIDIFNYTNDSAGMGVIITEKYRKKGFAKEALNLLTDYAFIILDINQLHATVANLLILFCVQNHKR